MLNSISRYAVSFFRNCLEPYREPETLENLQQELNQLNTLTGAIFVKSDEFNKPGSTVLLTNYYTTKKSWDEFYNIFTQKK